MNQNIFGLSFWDIIYREISIVLRVCVYVCVWTGAGIDRQHPLWFKVAAQRKDKQDLRLFLAFVFVLGYVHVIKRRECLARVASLIKTQVK